MCKYCEHCNNYDEGPYEPHASIVPFILYGVWAPNKKITSLVVTRGCPYSCVFCNAFVTAGKKQRRMSTERVIDEMINLKKNWNINYICFKDSTFTIDRKWILSLCNKMIEKDLKMEWRCNSRVNLVDEELLIIMKEAGCTCISYGVESGSKRILNKLKKGTTIKQIKKTFKVTNKVGIEIHSSYMIGNPEETKEEVYETIKLAKEINPDYALFNITAAYPETELYNNAVLENKINDAKWYMKERSYKEDKVMIASQEGAWLKTGFDKKKMIKKAYISFYFNTKFIFKTIKRMIRKPSLFYLVLEVIPQIFNSK